MAPALDPIAVAGELERDGCHILAERNLTIRRIEDGHARKPLLVDRAGRAGPVGGRGGPYTAAAVDLSVAKAVGAIPELHGQAVSDRDQVDLAGNFKLQHGGRKPLGQKPQYQPVVGEHATVLDQPVAARQGCKAGDRSDIERPVQRQIPRDTSAVVQWAFEGVLRAEQRGLSQAPVQLRVRCKAQRANR